MNPIDYSQIILAAVLGYAVFGEVPSVWTWAGAAVIVSSTLYILLREDALGRQRA
jgi:drug/metabolite transporter (DMT)-like permease